MAVKKYDLVLLGDDISMPFVKLIARELEDKPARDASAAEGETLEMLLESLQDANPPEAGTVEARGLNFAVGKIHSVPFNDSERFNWVRKPISAGDAPLKTLTGQNVYYVKQFLPEVSLIERLRKLTPSLKDVSEEAMARKVYELAHYSPNINDQYMDLLQAARIIGTSDAQGASLIVPYSPYMRQDKKDRSGVTIVARLVADLVRTAGDTKLQRYMSMKLHAPQVTGFFQPVPCDDLPSDSLFAWYIKQILFRDLYKQKAHASDLVVGFPDEGSLKSGREFAKSLGLPYAFVDKGRPIHASLGGKPAAYGVYSKVPLAGKTIIGLDDMVSTGSTICLARDSFLAEGAARVYFFATHYIGNAAFDEKGNLCGLAEDELFAPDLADRFQLITTNTVPLSDEYLKAHNITELNAATFFAEAIYRKIIGEPISETFTDEYINNKIYWRAHRADRMVRNPSRPAFAPRATEAPSQPTS